MAPAGYGNKVEGTHAVLAAALAGRVQRLYVERGRIDRPGMGQIVDSVDPDRLVVVDDVRPMATTDAPQGVVAECRPIVPVSLETVLGAANSVLVLDHVEDPHNVGAVARSVAAAGVGGMVVSSRRAAPLSAAAFKSAAGALETVPVAVVGSIPEALSRLKGLGCWVIGLVPRAEESLFGLALLTEPVAVVIGAEGSGLARLTLQRCDLAVSVPMMEGVESLNASISAALAAFEIMRIRSAT